MKKKKKGSLVRHSRPLSRDISGIKKCHCYITCYRQITPNKSDNHKIYLSNKIRDTDLYFKTRSLPKSTITRGQKGGQSGSNECSFKVMEIGKGHTITWVIEALEIPTTPTKDLSVTRSWAVKCLIMCPTKLSSSHTANVFPQHKKALSVTILPKADELRSNKGLNRRITRPV